MKTFSLLFASWLMENCQLSEDQTVWTYNNEEYTLLALFYKWQELNPKSIESELEIICKDLQDHLYKNHHPHTTAMVTSTYSEIVEGVKMVETTNQSSDRRKREGWEEFQETIEKGLSS